jgi:hypothetical protein
VTESNTAGHDVAAGCTDSVLFDLELKLQRGYFPLTYQWSMAWNIVTGIGCKTPP